MEGKDSLVNELEQAADRFFDHVGLGRSCAVVYAGLAGRASATELELAAVCSMPLDEVSAAVRTLAEGGFVRISDEGPRLVSMLHPGAGVAATITCSEERASSELARLADLRLLSAELARVHADLRAERDAGSFERLDDAHATVTRLHELNHLTEDEILTCVPMKPHLSALDGARAEDAALLARGVRVRAIYLRACQNEPAIMEYLQWMHLQGASVRLAPTLPTRLQIFDRRTAVVARSPEGTQAGAIVVHSEGLVAALLRLFDMSWAAAQAPFGLPPTAGDLAAQERELVRLLGRGMKDETVARKMGVSVRTVRRSIAELSDRLQASSRFELGVRCAEQGWTEV